VAPVEKHFSYWRTNLAPGNRIPLLPLSGRTRGIAHWQLAPNTTSVAATESLVPSAIAQRTAAQPETGLRGHDKLYGCNGSVRDGHAFAAVHPTETGQCGRRDDGLGMTAAGLSGH